MFTHFKPFKQSLHKNLHFPYDFQKIFKNHFCVPVKSDKVANVHDKNGGSEEFHSKFYLSQPAKETKFFLVQYIVQTSFSVEQLRCMLLLLRLASFIV